ncbi:unnamed protein product [Pleuronectes platessa]|uniref:Uncharacterized protein n=1 Tax=Pleuronectes platessa TaxID=8262 RepID=A0A9N7TY69_PLEPL|nr:unnamed protein product [Pleuronectes platessa]
MGISFWLLPLELSQMKPILQKLADNQNPSAEPPNPPPNAQQGKIDCCVWQGAWLAPGFSGRGTPAHNSSHHPLHKSLVCSPFQRQIIPSIPNLCVPYRSAFHPRLVLDLPASQHPAAPACTSFSCQ